MAVWTKNKPKYRKVYEYIRATNGITVAELAYIFKTNKTTVYRWLPALEDCGLLLYQDKDRLFHFDSK